MDVRVRLQFSLSYSFVSVDGCFYEGIVQDITYNVRVYCHCNVFTKPVLILMKSIRIISKSLHKNTSHVEPKERSD